MAQIYRVGKDIFDASTNQKIANPTVLATQYKGATEVNAPSQIPTGATKILNPAGLQGLNESQIFRQGADIYKLPSVISSDKITGGAAPTIKPVEPSFTDTAPYVAGLDTTTKGLESLVNTALAPTPQEAKITPITSKITELTGQFEQKPVDYQTELDKYGFKTNVQDLQNLNTQIASVKAQYDKFSVGQEGRTASASSIYGRQALAQRQAAVELGGLSSMAQALQGNVQMAQSIADKTIAIKYEPVEQEIANQKFQLEQVYEQLSRDEKKKADALKITLDERQRLIDEQKTKEDDINKIMLSAAQNGADSTTLQKIVNSKTVADAILNSGQYIKTASTSTWDTFTDTATGETKLINKQTGDVKNIGQSTTNLGTQIGEISGLPSYDTRTENPGVNRSNRNNNPGNIKVSDYTKEFDGVIGVESTPAQDGGNFLIFDSPEAGINAIGRLLKDGKSYKGVTAEQAIKKYNGNGSYGAETVGLDPNQDFQSQIRDEAKLKEVATKIAQAEGFTGGTATPSSVQSLVELVKKGTLTPEQALAQVKTQYDKQKLTEELAKIEITPVISEYNQERANRTLQSVDELLPQISPYTVGWGVLSKGVPTSPARNFAAQLDTLKSAIAFGELTAMREASKTGGALGQVSDKEGKLLESALGALDQGQSPEQFKAQLEKIKASINRWYGAVDTFKNENNISNVNLDDLNFKFK